MSQELNHRSNTLDRWLDHTINDLANWCQYWLSTADLAKTMPNEEIRERHLGHLQSLESLAHLMLPLALERLQLTLASETAKITERNSLLTGPFREKSTQTDGQGFLFAPNMISPPPLQGLSSLTTLVELSSCNLTKEEEKFSTVPSQQENSTSAFKIDIDLLSTMMPFDYQQQHQSIVDDYDSISSGEEMFLTTEPKSLKAEESTKSLKTEGQVSPKFESSKTGNSQSFAENDDEDKTILQLTEKLMSQASEIDTSGLLPTTTIIDLEEGEIDD